jgi:hypothetical protein
VSSARLFVIRSSFFVAYGCVIAGGAAAVGAAIAWHRGSTELAKNVVLIVPLAVALMFTWTRLAKRWHAQAADDLRRELGESREPRESPVPWISSETWRRENAWNPHYEVLYGDPAGGASVEEAQVFEADDHDRDAAPVVRVPDGTPVPRPGATGDLAAALASAPSARGLTLRSPSWPVCCERLAALVGHDGVDGFARRSLPRAHFLYAEVRAGWGTGSDAEARARADEPYGKRSLDEGHALFHCRSCGRLYLGSYHP